MTDRQFVHRVALASLVVTAFLAAAALLVRQPVVPLLAFAGMLGAIVLDALARPLRRFAGLPRSAAIAIVALASIALTALFVWRYGPRAFDETAQLVARLPRSAASLWRGLRPAGGGDILSAVTDGAEQVDWKSFAPLVFGSVANVFTTALGAATGALATFALSIFLALRPRLYLRGALHLVPREQRARAEQILVAIGHALRWWLVGRCVAMAAVAGITLAGLLLLGVPQALALSVLVGLLTFVPYAGPVLGAIPAVLIAASVSLATSLWVIALYTGVQMLENYVVTPIAEGRAVSMPPALLIVAGALMAVVFGGLGVLLSTPLTIALVVLVQALYVEDALGEPVPLLGEEAPARREAGRR